MKKIIDWFKGLFGSSPSADDSNKDSSKAFTLIELLIVIAVIGILAAVVLIAIDPVEQLARGRDSNIKSSVSSVGRASQAYYTVTGEYPDKDGTVTAWLTELKSAGEIKSLPTGYGTPSCTNIESQLCLVVNNTTDEYVVYTYLESDAESNKGTCNGVKNSTWYVYSSSDGKAGTYCDTSPPTVKEYGASLL